MRKYFLPLLMAGLALSSAAQTRVAGEKISIAQLEERLAGEHREADGKVARELASLELTERLSDSRSTRLAADLPGAASRQALVTVTAASQFLELPAAEILALPAPDRATQTALLARTREYVLETIKKLPNLLATRNTANFEGTLPEEQKALPHAKKIEPLHEVSHSNGIVLYRDNRESTVEGKGLNASAKRLQTAGEFGPILITVLHDAAKGRVTWSHWEQGRNGPMAVFHYEVPEEQSHYMVSSSSFEHQSRHDPGYHGVLALDAANGAILRVTVMAELQLDDPMTSADLLVDYGPVEIGGMNYICPLRSVALSQVRMVVQERNFNTGNVEGTTLGQARTYLNEVLFTQYHLFRGEVRIVAGGDADGRGAGSAPLSRP